MELLQRDFAAKLKKLAESSLANLDDKSKDPLRVLREIKDRVHAQPL